MSSTFTHIAIGLAVLAIFVADFMVIQKRVLRSLVAAVAFGVVAALLVTAVRALG